jgi:dipeptidyl aminopeptidase/acylaminoacyl peptidase
LLVNYRGGIGYGREFRQALAGGRGRVEMDDVVAGAEFLADRPAVDGDAVGIWGLSYGGYATLQLLGTSPETFAVGVNLAGVSDLEAFREWSLGRKMPAVASSTEVSLGGSPWEVPEEWAAASPVTHMKNYEVPLYSFHGTDDDYVDVGQLDIVVDELLDRGKAYEAEYYPGENHVFARRRTWERTLSRTTAAFDEHLADGAGRDDADG